MTEREIIRCIDDGANFYLQFFGDAVHMDYKKNDFYSFIQPKQGEQGVCYIFNVKLEKLSKKEQNEKIAEIKALNMPVWWDLQCSDGLFQLIHGKNREKINKEPADGDELYMAILPDDALTSEIIPAGMLVKKVSNSADFEKWANAVNIIMNGGYADIHPINHYHLCKSGAINCFICYHNDNVVAVASIMNNEGVCSLEFVATDPNYRKQGLAKAVCSEAIKDAFNNGARIITVRAINEGTRELYSSLGYVIYNNAL
jgi:ribosomal protein S18 acetylase RimI-like enzyme